MVLPMIEQKSVNKPNSIDEIVISKNKKIEK